MGAGGRKMRTKLRILVVAVVAVAAALPAFAADPPTLPLGDHPPREIAGPGAGQMMAAWFQAVKIRAGAGAAVFHCTITLAGSLDACELVHETPAGRGFGAAAQNLLPLYRFEARVRSGSPVVSGELIEINFFGRGQYELASFALALAGVRALKPADLTGDDLRVGVSCLREPGGELRDCKAFSDNAGPRAEELAARSAMGFTKPWKPKTERIEDFEVDFNTSVDTQPDFDRTYRPSESLEFTSAQAKADRAVGLGVARCTIDAKGRPSGCWAVSESPVGYGFGESAVRVMSSVRYTPAVRDGKPVPGEIQSDVGFQAGP